MNLSLVTIDGWGVIVKTPGGATDFHAGEFVVFFEVDAWHSPEGELGRLFSEVGAPCDLDGKPGFRINTKQVTTTVGPKEVIRSQGYAIRLSAQKLSNLHEEFIKEAKGFEPLTFQNQQALAEFFQEKDYSHIVDVKKWEGEPETKAANPKLPLFILKSEMARVQNCPNLSKLWSFQRYRDVVFQESVKMDGASMTMCKYQAESFSLISSFPAVARGLAESASCQGTRDCR